MCLRSTHALCTVYELQGAISYFCYKDVNTAANPPTTGKVLSSLSGLLLEKTLKSFTWLVF